MEQEKKYWMIKVNPTRYNFFGAVREFYKELPWGFTTRNIREGDIVYFYLTSADKTTKGCQTAMPEKIVNKVFKRLVFKGKIKEVLDNIDTRDEKYWTDKHDTERGKNYALIEITDFIYDHNISNTELNGSSRGQAVTIELDSETAQMIDDILLEGQN